MRQLLKKTILPTQSNMVKKLHQLVNIHDEIVLYGPTECAKSFECLKIAHLLCATIPRFRCVVLRKARTTIYTTVLETLVNHILPFGLDKTDANLIEPYGGTKVPQWLDYKDTGARMIFYSEDKHTGKALGSQWDLAIYSQCEQSDPGFWEDLSGRCTGRAKNWWVNGEEHGLLLGECNPESSRHFLRRRAEEGRCKMYKFTHTDSAMFFYNGEYTKYGKKTIEKLKRKYTGYKFERLYLGNWVAATGAVYAAEYDKNIHDVEEQYILDQIKDDWCWTLSMDFGFRHPFVCSLFVAPPDFSKVYLYKEIYKTELDPEEMKRMVQRLVDKYVPSDKNLLWSVGDHKPEEHKALSKLGFPMTNAEKEILPGIVTVKEWLHNKRLFFNKNSLSHKPDENQEQKGNPTRTVEEIEVYVYKSEDKQTGSIQDEIPVALHDDGLDTVRYELMQITKKRIGPPDIEPTTFRIPRRTSIF